LDKSSIFILRIKQSIKLFFSRKTKRLFRFALFDLFQKLVYEKQHGGRRQFFKYFRKYFLNIFFSIRCSFLSRYLLAKLSNFSFFKKTLKIKIAKKKNIFKRIFIFFQNKVLFLHYKRGFNNFYLFRSFFYSLYPFRNYTFMPDCFLLFKNFWLPKVSNVLKYLTRRYNIRLPRRKRFIIFPFSNTYVRKKFLLKLFKAMKTYNFLNHLFRIVVPFSSKVLFVKIRNLLN
jgi:hypothetical protein